jgi:hypothetical protein
MDETGGGVEPHCFGDASQNGFYYFYDMVEPGDPGLANEWSSYWYNGRIYSNSGLNRRGDTGNRGVDVFRLTGSLGRVAERAKRWSHSNPQTQEAWQAP